MSRHAKNCPCVVCFNERVQHTARRLTRIAVVIWAVIFAFVLWLIMAIDDLPPEGFGRSNQQQYQQSEPDYTASPQ